MCRQSEFQLSYFKLWMSCFDDDCEQEIGSDLRTHLAFDFHGVAISAPERLRLVKTPIHFPGCNFCTTTTHPPPPKKNKNKKTSARLCPPKVGLWLSDDPLRQNPTDSSPDASDFVSFVGFISRSGLIWFFPRCVSVREERTFRQNGRRSTHRVHSRMKFSNDISPPKKWNPVRCSRTARNFQI